jgi:hypothetical protein
VYGLLDVQRVAGNFHISVHGLNIFVAEKVINLKLEIIAIQPFLYFDCDVFVIIRFERQKTKLLKPKEQINSLL